MPALKTTLMTIGIVILALFAISVALTYYAGFGILIALSWNLLSVLDVNGNLLQFGPSVSDPFVFGASLLDAFIFALLTVLLAAVFFNFIKQINIRARVTVSRIKKLNGHVIIVPANPFAIALLNELDGSNIDRVVIAASEHDASQLHDRKELMIVGDPKTMDAFSAANVQHAKFVIACSKDDVENAMIAVTAKSINPKAKVIARVSKSDDIPKLGRAGAYMTMMPEIAAGEAISKEILKELTSK